MQVSLCLCLALCLFSLCPLSLLFVPGSPCVHPEAGVLFSWSSFLFYPYHQGDFFISMLTVAMSSLPYGVPEAVQPGVIQTHSRRLSGAPFCHGPPAHAGVSVGHRKAGVVAVF